MKLAILLIFVAAVFSQTVLLISDPSTTTIVSPLGLTVGLEGYHTTVNPDYLGTGANWIWNNQADAWADGYTNTFQALFYADCYQYPALLKAVADNEYKVYLNGATTPVLQGNNWFVSDSTNINLKCGLNNLTIVATNRHQSSPAAVVFSISQDQTNCYNCTTPLYYNSGICGCDCVGGCNCSAINPNWVWLGAPTCACTCLKIPKCGPLEEFNPNTCRCQCRYRICPPGYVFDEKTCGCIRKVCPPRPCSQWKEWSSIICGCICKNMQSCSPGFSWDDLLCRCVFQKIIINFPKFPDITFDPNFPYPGPLASAAVNDAAVSGAVTLKSASLP